MALLSLKLQKKIKVIQSIVIFAQKTKMFIPLQQALMQMLQKIHLLNAAERLREIVSQAQKALR